jgi:PII-like signaling protein
MTAPTACRLTVVVDEDAMHGHRPQYLEIVQRAHAAGLAGASVFRGIEGFGASRAGHTNRIISLSGKLPVMVVIVDDAQKVRAFVPVLRELGVRGVVTIENLERL